MECAASVEDGSRSAERPPLVWDQTVRMGEWHRLGEVDLQPGASLEIDPAASQGTVIADGFAIVPVE